jgi:predicted nucleic acid-binding protein
MSPFPDTSFLFSLYRTQDNSSRADRIFSALKTPLAVSSLLLLEFRQSARFQVGLYQRDNTKGFSKRESEEMLGDLKKDLDSGLLEIVPVEWLEVHNIAEGLSEKHTASGSHRLIDVLHVATALYLEVDEFLTFDSNQKKLAQAEGLKVSH